MTAVTLPNVGLTAGYQPAETGWSPSMNKNLRTLDAVAQAVVVDKDLSTPPASPVAGSMYIVAASPTGAWAGQAARLALWQVGDDLASAWLFITPRTGWLVYVADESKRYQYAAGAWAEFVAGGGGGTAATVTVADSGNYYTGTNVEAALQEIGATFAASVAPVATIANDLISYASDLTTPLVAGVVGSFTPAPRAAQITGVKANLRTASTSGAITIDIKKNGVSILSSYLQIDFNELTSVTANTAAVVVTTTVAADDIFTYQILSGGAGATGLIITLLMSTNITVTGPTAVDTSNTVTALAIASGVVVVDLSLGDYYTLALSANVTSWTFSNPPGAGKGYSKIIEIRQDATAAKTLAWPSGTWDGLAPAISTTLNAVQLMTIVSHNNNTTRRMNLSGVHA